MSKIIGIAGEINSGKDVVANMIRYLIARKNDKRDIDILTAEFLGLTENNWVAINDRQPFIIKRFADKVKDIICIILNCTRKDLENRKFKEKELPEKWWYYQIEYNQIMYTTLEEATAENIKLMKLYNVKSDIKVVKLTPRKMMQLIGTKCGRNIIHPNIWVNTITDEYDNSKYKNWIMPDVRFKNEAQSILDRNGIIIKVNRTCTKCNEYENVNCKDDYHLKDKDESETSLIDFKFDYIINNDKDITELMKNVKNILIKEQLLF